MPKRPNPFGDASPLQFKTYITKKEVDTGVCREKNMKVVYEKTKSLLYEGSKKLNDEKMNVAPCMMEMSDLHPASINRSEVDQLPGQLHIDSHGQLCALQSNNNNVTAASTFNFNQTLPANSISVPVNAIPVADDDAMETGVHHPGPTHTNAFNLLMGATSQSKPSNTFAAVTKPMCTASVGFRICQTCNHPSTVGTRQCGFCDKVTCSTCVRQCHICQGLFCHVCSLLDYSDNMEEACCLQCRS